MCSSRKKELGGFVTNLVALVTSGLQYFSRFHQNYKRDKWCSRTTSTLDPAHTVWANTNPGFSSSGDADLTLFEVG